METKEQKIARIKANIEKSSIIPVFTDAYWKATRKPEYTPKKRPSRSLFYNRFAFLRALDNLAVSGYEEFANEMVRTMDFCKAFFKPSEVLQHFNELQTPYIRHEPFDYIATFLKPEDIGAGKGLIKKYLDELEGFINEA